MSDDDLRLWRRLREIATSKLLQEDLSGDLLAFKRSVDNLKNVLYRHDKRVTLAFDCLMLEEFAKLVRRLVSFAESLPDPQPRTHKPKPKQVAKSPRKR